MSAIYSDPARAETLPACALYMGCLCAAHARCLNVPGCDADEHAARELGPCECCNDTDDDGGSL